MDLKNYKIENRFYKKSRDTPFIEKYKQKGWS